jgi:hypothetical protein
VEKTIEGSDRTESLPQAAEMWFEAVVVVHDNERQMGEPEKTGVCPGFARVSFLKQYQ